MLRRWTGARAAAAAVLAAALLVMLAATPAAGTTPMSAGSSAESALPDTSAAVSGPVGDAALAAVPHAAAIPPAAAPGHAAAPPAIPPIGPPYYSDGFCSYISVKFASCTDALLGTYDPLDNCFWKVLAPQPPAGDPLWQGHSPSQGNLYTVTCATHNGSNIGNAAATVEFSSQIPLNYNQNLGPLQASILNAIVTVLALSPVPVVGTLPPTGSGGVVGLPTWQWLQIPPALWNPPPLSKKVLGVNVMLSLRGVQVDWDMNDGHHVICATPGTSVGAPPGSSFKAYVGTPAGPSPDCGYTYAAAGTYATTSTATWYVGFNVLGFSGTLVLSRTTKVTNLKIGELQVVTE
jgi:hypothetical protein